MSTQFELWKTAFLANKEWGPMFVFGPKFPGPIGDTEPYKRKIKHTENFVNRLKELAFKYELKIDHPDKLEFSENSYFYKSKFDSEFNYDIINLVNKSKESVQKIESIIREIEENNKKYPKGRTSVPIFFATYVLTAIEAFRADEIFLKKIKTYIEPSGELEEWLLKQFVKNSTRENIKDIILSWITSTSSGESITKWADQKKLTLEFSIISTRLKKTINTISEEPEEFETLRSEIRNCAINLQAGCIQ